MLQPLGDGHGTGLVADKVGGAFDELGHLQQVFGRLILNFSEAVAEVAVLMLSSNEEDLVSDVLHQFPPWERLVVVPLGAVHDDAAVWLGFDGQPWLGSSWQIRDDLAVLRVAGVRVHQVARLAVPAASELLRRPVDLGVGGFVGPALGDVGLRLNKRNDEVLTFDDALGSPVVTEQETAGGRRVLGDAERNHDVSKVASGGPVHARSMHTRFSSGSGYTSMTLS